MGSDTPFQPRNGYAGTAIVAQRRDMMADTSLNDLTVLIIADDAKLLGPLTHMVRDFGVRSVVMASDGEDGLAVLCAEPIDMIIGDFGAGPVDGLDFTRRLRRGDDGSRRAIPIIMLATPEQRATVEQAGDIGVDGFLAKPVSPSSLYSRMLAVASRPRAFVDTEAYSGPDRRGDRPPSADQAADEAGPADHEAPAEISFVQSARHDVEAIIRAYEEAVSDPGGRRQSVRLIGCLADIIADQGVRSGYPLMSEIARSLCDYCRAIPEPGDNQLDIVKAHADTMDAVVTDELSGDGGAVGGALLGLLHVSVQPPDNHPRVPAARKSHGPPRPPGQYRHIADSAETLPVSPI